MEDIVFVTGYHRTRSWSNIAFYESQADSRVSLSVQTPSTHGTTVRWRVLSQGMQGAVLHHGPSGEVCNLLIAPAIAEMLGCVFLRTYLIANAYSSGDFVSNVFSG